MKKINRKIVKKLFMKESIMIKNKQSEEKKTLEARNKRGKNKDKNHLK